MLRKYPTFLTRAAAGGLFLVLAGLPFCETKAAIGEFEGVRYHSFASLFPSLACGDAEEIPATTDFGAIFAVTELIPGGS
jgi:hypothetical protein